MCPFCGGRTRIWFIGKISCWVMAVDIANPDSNFCSYNSQKILFFFYSHVCFGVEEQSLLVKVKSWP